MCSKISMGTVNLISNSERNNETRQDLKRKFTPPPKKKLYKDTHQIPHHTPLWIIEINTSFYSPFSYLLLNPCYLKEKKSKRIFK